MDDARFDGLTRTLSEGMTRRGITRLLGGLILGGLLHPLASEAKKRGHGKGKGKGKKDKKDQKGNDGKQRASASGGGCRPPGVSCTRNRQCCSDRCSGNGLCRCTETSQCSGGTTCQNGQCVCPTGTQDCNGDGSCESLNTTQHCGGCGVTCSSGQVCDGGLCVGGCQAEDRQTTCGPDGCGQKTNNCGQSVDCGGCAGNTCQNGQCVTPTPPCSTDTDCPSGQVCQSGTCGTPTPQCVNDWDCPYLHVCRSGQCGCPAGWQDCGTTCADTQTNWSRCGSCDHACGYAEDCVNGQCVCNASACLRGGRCVYNISNEACGTSCTDCTATGKTCQNGICARCGDGVCNGCETCSDCPQDCGQCPLCTNDGECAAAGWCHPTTCVHVNGQPICGGACDTGGCTFGEIGCEAYCACQGGLCVAVPFDWGF